MEKHKEDLDRIDFNNYKGIFHDNDHEQRYEDKTTGAHFEYYDMCRRLRKLQQSLLSIPIEKPQKALLHKGRNDIKMYGTKFELHSSNFNVALMPKPLNRQEVASYDYPVLRSKSTDKPTAEPIKQSVDAQRRLKSKNKISTNPQQSVITCRRRIRRLMSDMEVLHRAMQQPNPRNRRANSHIAQAKLHVSALNAAETRVLCGDYGPRVKCLPSEVSRVLHNYQTSQRMRLKETVYGQHNREYAKGTRNKILAKTNEHMKKQLFQTKEFCISRAISYYH